MKKIFYLFIIYSLVTSCNSANEQVGKTDTISKENVAIANADSLKKDSSNIAMGEGQQLSKDLKYDYKYDPICGMPTTAGVADTARFENKLYGFCSNECKEEFLKDPKKALAESRK